MPVASRLLVSRDLLLGFKNSSFLPDRFQLKYWAMVMTPPPIDESERNDEIFTITCPGSSETTCDGLRRAWSNENSREATGARIAFDADGARVRRVDKPKINWRDYRNCAKWNWWPHVKTPAALSRRRPRRATRNGDLVRGGREFTK